jgi:hypothetical protein
MAGVSMRFTVFGRVRHSTATPRSTWATRGSHIERAEAGIAALSASEGGG